MRFAREIFKFSIYKSPSIDILYDMYFNVSFYSSVCPVRKNNDLLYYRVLINITSKRTYSCYFQLFHSFGQLFCFSISPINPNDLYAVIDANFHLSRFPVLMTAAVAAAVTRVIVIRFFKQFKGAPRTTKITYIVGTH